MARVATMYNVVYFGVVISGLRLKFGSEIADICRDWIVRQIGLWHRNKLNRSVTATVSTLWWCCILTVISQFHVQIVIFFSYETIFLIQIVYVFWWIQIFIQATIQFANYNNNNPPLCTSDVFEEKNKCLCNMLKIITDIWALWLVKKKNKKREISQISESLQSSHTPSMPRRHPKFGILATVYCRVNFTLENSHKLLDKTYNKNNCKYFKYDWNVQYIRQFYI